MDTEILELRVLLTGRVQGVGMRSKINKEATLLKLVGYAQNLPDGRVEILAQGPKTALEKFIVKIKATSPNITHIEIVYKLVEKPFSSFQIF